MPRIIYGSVDRDDDERLEANERLEGAGWTETILAPRPKPRPFERVCLNCGQMFRAPPSDKTRTCSPDCSIRHRSRKHIGKHNVWSDTSAAREAARLTGNLRLGSPAARSSRKAGPFTTNINAKIWIVVSPEGEQYEAQNLRLWCTEQFGAEDGRLAYAGLRQIALWMRGKTRRPVRSWRGWSLAKPPMVRQ